MGLDQLEKRLPVGEFLRRHGVFEFPHGDSDPARQDELVHQNRIGP